ncbi:MAG: hypothetical protein KIT11_07710 [Fimbriimonadaceae bacterium]|nr:hypothetical protein [Fimbriimonadaceae bacterium]QYK56239.1 MAG: hypothetical protein KF733_01900 [Fimbriimonadaceae bacterium]
MTALLLALSWVAPLSDPWRRVDALVGGKPGLRAEFELRVNGGAPMKGTYLVSGEIDQQLDVEAGGERTSLRQGRAGVLYLQFAAKRYAEYPRVPVRADAPPTAAPSLSRAYPYLLARWPKPFHELYPGWTVVGQEEVAGVVADHLRPSGASGGQESQQEVWIDSQGRLLRHRIEQAVADSKIQLQFDFMRFEPLDEAPRVSLDIPWGYVPIEHPKLPTLWPGNAVPPVKLTVLGGEVIDLVEASKIRPMLLVFTSPDCPVCDRAGAFWPKLEEAAKRADARIVEVLLDAEKGPGRLHGASVLDTAGTAEHAFSVPGTPYFYVTSAKSQIAAAWSGYSAEQEETILETLFAKER